MPTLTIDITSDPDKHYRTDWQVSELSDFSSLVFNFSSHQNLTWLTVPHRILAHGTKYYWRALTYDKDIGGSYWSNASTFTTWMNTNDQNSNGIPDDLEDETIDVDLDNIPDSTQDDIKSLNTVIGDAQIGISFRNDPSITSIDSIDSIDPMTIPSKSRPSQMPLGLVAFRIRLSIPGEEVEVTVHLSETASDNMIWYMYNSVDGWSDYSDYSTYSKDRMSIVLKLKDGGYGDADGTRNGIIVDPSGFGIASFVQGQIYDTTNSQGVDRAEIKIEDIKAITLNDGHYLMMILPGQYDVNVVAVGYNSLTNTIEIPVGEVIRKDFALTPGEPNAPEDNSNKGGGGGGGCFLSTMFD